MLGDVGVYEQEEVETFNRLYFDGVDAQALSPIIDTVAHRFNEELGLNGNPPTKPQQLEVEFLIKEIQ